MEKLKVGIQLYTLRDQTEKDLVGTLQTVKKIGYDYVEYAGYFGYSAADLKKLTEDCGLIGISTHYGLDNFKNPDTFDANVAYQKELGVKYVAIPWMDKMEGLAGGEEALAKTAELMTKTAIALKKNGMQLLYHNHDFEFEPVGDKLPIDALYEAVPELMPEFDTCWVKYAGYDPVEYINKYSGRTPVIHLKDFVGKKGSTQVYALVDKDGNPVGGDNSDVSAFAFRSVGSGIQNFPAIIRAGIASGAEAIIVEQDDCYGDSFGAAEASRAYLKSIGF